MKNLLKNKIFILTCLFVFCLIPGIIFLLPNKGNSKVDKTSAASASYSVSATTYIRDSSGNLKFGISLSGWEIQLGNSSSDKTNQGAGNLKTLNANDSTYSDSGTWKGIVAWETKRSFKIWKENCTLSLLSTTGASLRDDSPVQIDMYEGSTFLKSWNTTLKDLKNSGISCQKTLGSYTNRVSVELKFYPNILYTFQKNGGSGGWNSIRYNGKEDRAYDADGYALRGPISLPTKTGYTCSGYYTATSGGTQVINASGGWTGNWNLNNVRVAPLYAQWTANLYYLTLDPNGGSFSYRPSDWSGTASSPYKGVYYDSTYGDLPTPTRMGYKFDGWYTSASGGSKVDQNTKMQSTSGSTIYAHWTAEQYTVTFNKNGGQGGTGDIKITYDTQPTTTALITPPTRTGYTFQGYFTSTTSTVKYFDNTGKLVKKWDIASNTTLYAQWTANSYKVALSPNGGSFPTDLPTGWAVRASGNIYKKFTYDTTFGTLPEPTRTGYIFAGYYTDVSGGTKVESTTKMTFTSDDAVLYAHWNPIQYTVNLDPNGGSFASDKVTSPWTLSSGVLSTTATYDKTLTLPTMIKYDSSYAPNFVITRPGYIFKGWATSKTATTVEYNRRDGATVKNLSAINHDSVVLYAVWEQTQAASAQKPNVGNGSEKTPYQVSTAQELAWINKEPNLNYKQVSNIDISSMAWLPIENFTGIFDGNGFYIQGLHTLSQTNATGIQMYSAVGLFGRTDTGNLKNITLIRKADEKVIGYDSVGSIAGVAKYGSITNCLSYAVVEGFSAVGMIGFAEQVNISALYNYGNISASSLSSSACCGGLVGCTQGRVRIANSYANCTVSGYNVGGFVGFLYEYSEILNCGFEGNLSGKKCAVFFGGSDSSIHDCFANVTGNNLFIVLGGNQTVDNVIFIAQKAYKGKTFSNWVYDASSGKFLPKGLAWLASGYQNVTTALLDSLGYKAM